MLLGARGCLRPAGVHARRLRRAGGGARPACAPRVGDSAAPADDTLPAPVPDVRARRVRVQPVPTIIRSPPAAAPATAPAAAPKREAPQPDAGGAPQAASPEQGCIGVSGDYQRRRAHMDEIIWGPHHDRSGFADDQSPEWAHRIFAAIMGVFVGFALYHFISGTAGIDTSATRALTAAPAELQQHKLRHLLRPSDDAPPRAP
eukprot:TRINITY_DN26924_c0_g1_i1.p2 TRINITY_DN26924_c0_g1~~TRINITY_DN26924_c0_g1_i1.p2  ORF type:complete len:227 (+),score=44.92 TRINITY_DN26924_c0_g1_i1:73-681(+)